jgi:glutathione S-transferase
MDKPFTLVIGNRNYSSWSLRPWFFLRVSKIPFTEIRIPLDQPETRAAIAAHSPTGRVPVLHDGDLRVWESLAICEHAAERHGLDGWPAEPAARAFARACAHEMHAGFSAMRNEFPMNCRARRRGVTASPAAAGDIRRISQIWAQGRDNFGAEGPWLCGSFSIADAMYAPVVMRSRTYGWDLPGSAETYSQNVATHPALLEWVRQAKAETESIPHEEVGEDY